MNEYNVINITSKKEKIFRAVLLFTIASLLIDNYTNKNILFFFGILTWFYVFMKSKGNYSVKFTLIRLIVLSVPLSFINVFNGAYGKLPLSWFNIFCLMFFISTSGTILKKGSVRVNSLFNISLITLVIGVIPLLHSIDIVDGFKQYLNITIVFLNIMFGLVVKKRLTFKEKDQLYYDYINTVNIAAIGVILQYILIDIMGIYVGTYALFGGNRKAYAFLFSDYSFLSLYLASGAAMLYAMRFERKEKKLPQLINILFLLLASTITSARTGVIAFIIVVFIYGFYEGLRQIGRNPIRIILLVVSNTTLIFVSYKVLKYFRPSGGGSGRMILNKQAINVFLESPFLGVGFGVGNYGSAVGTIPHNLFFQFLAQGGLVYIIPILFFIIISMVYAFKKGKRILIPLSTILVGAMFIPDIFNSRFLAVVLLLLSIL